VTNVFLKEWDILVILEACRLGLYQESIDPDAEIIWSIGGSSEEWLANMFDDVDTSDMIYVIENLLSKDYL
jgi:hypothetical protein